MSVVPIVSEEGEYVDPFDEANPVRRRIQAARKSRESFEPTWNSNIAWARGQHWNVWDTDLRMLRRIEDVDPKYLNRELVTVDLITEYRTTILGELGSDDDRPQLLLVQDNPAAEKLQAQVNRGVGYAWDYEIGADEAIAEVDRLTLDLGTSAMRCRWDPNFGPVVGEAPYMNGKPLPMKEFAQMVDVAQGPVPGVSMEQVQQGRITWEPCSAFNLLPPPGVSHERNFPWECIVRAVPIEDVKDEFPEATGLQEDKNIANTMGQVIGSGQSGAPLTVGSANDSRLKDHVWLFTYYEKPTKKYPQGRTMVFAGQQLKFLRMEKSLPYAKLDYNNEPLDWWSGIVYFHYWRVTGQFWSRALVENLKQSNAAYDKRRTQINEIIDRGLPTVFVQQGSEAARRTDIPLEIVELGIAERRPDFYEGLSPGDWMYKEIQQLESDMERASGVRAPALGENPSNVITLGQLSLLREADQVKRAPTMVERKASIAKLVEATVYDMRLYWGREKNIALAGEEDMVEADVFNAETIPPFFIIKVAKGTAKPRSQGAELTKIEQIWDAVVESGAVALDPLKYTEWYYDSLEAGQALDLPDVGQDDQVEKAEIENHKMMDGEIVPPAYYDPIQIHLPIHRGQQIQAELAGDQNSWMRIEQHIQWHQQMAVMNVEAAATNAGVPPEEAPNESTEQEGTGIPQGGSTEGGSTGGAG